MEYATVFDVTQNGFRTWWFPAFGLLVMILGLRSFGSEAAKRSKFTPALKVFFWVFGPLWIIGTSVFTVAEYVSLSSALRHGRCEVVEGVVTQFDPMPYEGHKEESFSVGNRRFHYSDYAVTSGFHNSRSHDGAIQEGVNVRIHCTGNAIAKLEIANR